ncbi:hypothetical protein AVEN_139146-1 [Araneus ventricosus]|uniref:Uncharacterized protein n=1 Tax=Araneus ventricosus TaxID=182803 RepID=A0A4Y2JK78_ARAVE|nr:hypothetical protein AVEN_139146-1 [Araneus ventricosus]
MSDNGKIEASGGRGPSPIRPYLRRPTFIASKEIALSIGANLLDAIEKSINLAHCYDRSMEDRDDEESSPREVVYFKVCEPRLSMHMC